MHKTIPLLLILLIILGIAILYALLQPDKSPNLSASLNFGGSPAGEKQSNTNQAQQNRVEIIPGELKLKETRSIITEIRTETKSQPQTQPQFQYPIYPQFPSQSTHFIGIKNFAFSPSDIRVAAGSKIVWINEDLVDHTATGGIIQSPRLGPGARYEIILTQRGVYDYFCNFHPHMRGRIFVD